MKRKNESGVVVVEAAIVVTVVTMLIATMLYIGMVLYQQSLVNIMANQTASNIAQIYGNTLRDSFTGYVDADGINETITYTNLRNDAYTNVIQQKADAAALYRLKSAKILTTGTTDVDVAIVPKSNELLKSQIIVTITDKYKIPFVSFFGVENNELEFTATGRADCTDLLDYINSVQVLGKPDLHSADLTQECTVNFYKFLGDTRPYKSMTVLKGYSVNSSVDYTHCQWPSEPKESPFVFNGKWFTLDENDKPFRELRADVPVSEDMNVYAQWKCEITLDGTKGKVNGTNIHKEDVVLGTQFSLPTPVADGLTGWRFLGWNTKIDGSGIVYANTVQIEGPITLYAQWQCNHKTSNNISRMEWIKRVQKLCREAPVGNTEKSYELHKCKDCGQESKKYIENKHYIDPDYLVVTHELLWTDEGINDFQAQCNVNHLSYAISGTVGNYDTEFLEGQNISAKYHITCNFCGMHSPKVYWTNVNGLNKYDYIYWVSDSSSREHTACREPNWRYN